METHRKSIAIDDVDRLGLFGRNDGNLGLIEQACDVELVARGDRLLVHGTPDSIQRASAILDHLVGSLKRGQPIAEDELRVLVKQDRFRPGTPAAAGDESAIKTYKAAVRARSAGQAHYLQAIEDNDLVFAIGPAGTGKTYLAVAMAVSALRQKKVARIVLTRPAVEAGENLGFLPGALEEKVDPYLRPLYDALQDLLEPERLRRYQEMKVIEVAPLAYMRGRTLNDAFIILDEAQNTTPPQMKMFLTRLGIRSNAVITGDITQIDLPKEQPSGLVEIQKILTEIIGVAFVYLTERDVMRNPLVQEIIRSYERFEQSTPPPERSTSQ